MEKACRLIIDKILNGEINTRRDLEKFKREVCRNFDLMKFMSNSDILKHAKPHEKEMVSKLLRKKPTRTISGVAIVAVMCHPHQCPHGRCFYCPESDVAPPSYTGEEPAALRARMFEFHPYTQTYNRLKQLSTVGHPVDKVELIIMGGTFPSRDSSYQEWFISQCLKAMNDFGGWDKDKIKVRTYPPNDYVLIEDVQKANEIANVRCIGMTFETRPDFCKKEDINRMLKMGVTRVELGVQTIYDNIYEKMERGHTVQDVIDANQLLRDSGIKVAMHFMPGLLSNPEEDYKMFKEVFENPNFKPDMLKIYPCLVTKGSKLYNLWKEGKYTPYSDKEAVDLIVKIKKILPKWVRTMRIQRDIPAKLIEAGVKKSNLGELVYNQLEKENVSCKCIRCREIGHILNKSKETINTEFEEFKLFKEDYEVNHGKEIFLSIEDKNEKILAGFLRLRFPSVKAFRKEINTKTAIVRELHIYGNMLKLGSKGKSVGQHTGFGEKLLQEAEKIAIQNGKDKILIISGIGARNYYRKFGYIREGPYMSKKLVN
ncbi:MAG: tRNA uridine(34) 5-carboxymethylaminomethyl modification radical SAM/GNAT enzyme Elp3 [Methanobrevibacter sp.]|jgi:elongator complex protein 3|nr:tRNA uridine(34) 5-carboxymethylaminomethyl modification radical SAM/GNAT enzyme Elp3 [Methanobrevibacter sp.]